MNPVYAEIQDDRIVVDSQWSDKELVRSLPGSRWDPQEKIWHAPVSWATCKQLRGIFQDRLEIGEALFAWASETVQGRIAPALELRGLMALPDDRKVDDRLYPFQDVGVEFLATSERVLLADEMGTGKTVQVIMALKVLREKHGKDAVFPALVTCPNSVKRQWHDEWAKWDPEITVKVVDTKKDLKDIDDPETRADVYVVNWERLRLHSRLSGYGNIALKKCEDCGGTAKTVATCQVHVKEFNQVAWNSVVADEAHKGKDPKAQQTRALWAIAHGLGCDGHDGARFRFGATGTPIQDTPDDLWAILHFLDDHEWPAKSKFIDRYCLQSWNPWGGMDVLGIRPETRQEFYEIFDPMFLRRPKDAVLPFLPKKVFVPRYVTLSRKERAAYDDMRDNLLIQAEDGEVLLAVNPLANNTRLTQLSAGTLEVAEDGEWILTEPSSKLDVLVELLDELGEEQVVVFAPSRQLIDLAAARLDKLAAKAGKGRKHLFTHVRITGDVSNAGREVAKQQFIEGDARIILVTTGAGGTGLDGLQVASHAVFLQRPWSLIEYQQACDRLHRIGQSGDSVNIINLIAENTVEEVQILALEGKFDRLQEIVRDEEVLAALRSGTINEKVLGSILAAERAA